MKASEIVNQIAVLLPQLSDLITTQVEVAAITRSGTTMTVVCRDTHGLKAGDGVAITNAVTQITAASIDRVDAVGTLVTASDHDLTSAIAETITVSGAVEAEFNGTFTVIAVLNRRTITFTMADAGPTSATGSPILLDAESQLRGYNTTYPVLDVLDATRFTFTQDDTSLLDPVGDTIVAKTKPRVSQVVDVERAAEMFTEQEVNVPWLFVSLENVVASKNRSIASDATDNLQRSNFFRQQIVQPFSVLLFVPSSASLSGMSSRDTAEDLFRPICRCVLFKAFDTGLSVGANNPVQFESHGANAYSSNLYIHAFSFSQVADLYVGDTVGPDVDVAFRDLEFDLFPDVFGAGTGVSFLHSEVDLDDTPL